MKIRQTILALVAATLGVAALPAMASAYFVDLPENPEFTVSNEGNTFLKTPESEIKCTGLSGSGSFADKHSGSVKFKITGCTAAGTQCTNAGGPKGTIETTTLPFDVVKVTHPKGTDAGPGVLVTPADESHGEHSGHFATFHCAFGLIGIEITGTGIIGTLEEPKVGTAANTFKLNFQENGSKEQTHTYADSTTGLATDGPYDLKVSVNGGAPETAAKVGKGFMHFVGEGHGTVTAAG